MMSLWDALRMNMMISYQELVRTFLSLLKILTDDTIFVCRARSHLNGGIGRGRRKTRQCQ